MLYIIFISLILLAMLDRAWRGRRIKTAMMDFEFSLFDIRDRLRSSAIAGEIPFNKWFDYMDTTLTRTIDSIDKVSPWLALAHYWSCRRSLDCAWSELNEILSRPENHKIARVYAMYTEAVNKFLDVRHPISWPLVVIIFAVAKKKSPKPESIKQKERKLAPIFSVVPETSTYSEYVGNGHASEVPVPPSLVLQ